MKKCLFFVFLFPLVCYSQEELLIDGDSCGIHGSAHENTIEYTQNVYKNRYNKPKSTDFDSKLQLQDFLNGKAIEGKYSEEVAVEVTGYVFDVKKGGVESCNCKTTDPLFKDTHIELTLNDRETGPEQRFIVEVTPRIRQKLAEQGIDWTTEALQQNIKGHNVKIQGWLFYDHSHKDENFADDPEDRRGKNNWRATSWEIHPITNIEVLDPMETMVVESGTNDKASNFNSPVTLNKSSKSSIKSASMESNPLNILILLILGAILGSVGQGVRVIVGLKKMNDEALAEKKSPQELMQTQQLLISLFIAFGIGAVAGVLAAVNNIDTETISKSTIFAFLAAGYAGTDFIEGFMKKNPNVAK